MQPFVTLYSTLKVKIIEFTLQCVTQFLYTPSVLVPYELQLLMQLYRSLFTIALEATVYLGEFVIKHTLYLPV